MHRQCGQLACLAAEQDECLRVDAATDGRVACSLQDVEHCPQEHSSALILPQVLCDAEKAM